MPHGMTVNTICSTNESVNTVTKDTEGPCFLAYKISILFGPCLHKVVPTAAGVT